MAKIKRIIPFNWLPANWGLTGSRRAKAYAEYYYEGEELAYMLLDADYPLEDDKNEPSYRLAKLKLDYRYHKVGEFDYGLGLLQNDVNLSNPDREREIAKYLHRFGKITAEELEYKLLDLAHDIKDTTEYTRSKLKLDVRFGKKTEEESDHELLDIQFEDKTTVDYKIAQLGLELKWGNITQNQHDKEVATLLREPWFNMIGGDKSIQGENVRMAIELDWNEYFIEFLESKGWSGVTADEIVDKWFEEAMRQMVLREEYGDIDTGSDDPMPMAGTVRTKRDDGLTEYR